jgi:hypothetical protein
MQNTASPQNNIVPFFNMHLKDNPQNFTNLFGSILCSLVKMEMKTIIIMKKTKKKMSTEESENKTDNF